MKTAFCFDLDGTLTRQEILPLIARDIDLYQEFEALTLATINGIIPFVNSFKLRCRILAEVPISRVKAIVSQVKLYDKVVQFVSNNKECCFIATGNLDIWIEELAQKIGCPIYSSVAKYTEDKLDGIEKILDKADAVDDIRAKGFNRVVAIGDGMGDVGMFQQADISIAYGATHCPNQTLLELSNFVTFNEDALCRTINTLL
ncbi:MAG: HAD-IB family phosphatase [Prevotellaceae bacterium]|jgi:HAD superfamily phosphoserine phosphatase-like hydrolase|nr:HAD-IB family phosphatase [Prevotellaceae bacterium]